MAEEKDIDIFDKDIDVTPISNPTPEDFDNNPDAPPIDNPIDDPNKPPKPITDPIDDPDAPPIDDPNKPPIDDPDAPPIIDPIDPPPTDPIDDKQVCLVVKVGSAKGKFVIVDYEYEVDNPDGTKLKQYAVKGLQEDDKFKSILERNDIVFIEDIVDYTTKEGMYYGEIREWDVETGIVTIYDENADSLLVEVDKYAIVKLHNKIDDKEVICKSLTFILSFIPEQGMVDNPRKLRGFPVYFPLYYYNPDNILEVMNEFIDNVTQKYNKERPSLKENAGIYYTFNDDYLKKNKISDLLSLDERLLKYFIMAVKNNPKYYEKNGYLYYFYDKAGNIIKNAIASNSSSVYGDINMAAISDNEVIILNKNCEDCINIVVYEDKIAPRVISDSSLMFMAMLVDDLYLGIEGKARHIEVNIGLPQNIMEKMNSFTKLLNTSLEV
jgi:hypothetical protein